ncbi:hypothetical protein BT96DRAFT_72373 [Gymnopus androsaceus JB14]|uniref:Uncharacterized protein n=1 Tax=Gymnopus androsaceus JB14 TaxID=1447944 RepID=A0A6A4HJ00_9AGAR|nr:hypothetical protein BT96DRAFT_72373 [Gymnopus androsaceus JB14]
MTTPVVDSEDTIKSEAIINEADSNGTEDAASSVKEPKERAPKPTGLGSLTGLGGLFWPWRGSTPNQDHLDSPKSTVEDPNSSGSGSGGSSDSTLKAPRSVSLDTRASPRWSPSGSGNASPGAKKLPASATVEVLSIIPPVPSPTSTSRRFPISPASIPFPSTSSPKLQSARERERIPSTSSLSSNSSIESMDSMMDVPVLERSASLSSVSTDGDGELAELADILHSQASVNLPSELHFGDHAWMETELTPVPNEMRAPWSGDFKYSPPRDDVNPEVGFFDKSGPGAGGVGVAAPEKPLDADPLYKAFVQQWCFAGAGNRSPAPTNNRNGLQVS